MGPPLPPIFFLEPPLGELLLIDIAIFSLHGGQITEGTTVREYMHEPRLCMEVAAEWQQYVGLCGSEPLVRLAAVYT